MNRIYEEDLPRVGETVVLYDEEIDSYGIGQLYVDDDGRVMWLLQGGARANLVAYTHWTPAPRPAEPEKMVAGRETFRERLQREHPESVNERWTGGCCQCPSDYGYEGVRPRCPVEKGPSESMDDRCRRCWDRIIPEVVHAHWIDMGEDPNDPGSGNHQYLCSACVHGDISAAAIDVPYCWHCGAKMDEEVE